MGEIVMNQNSHAVMLVQEIQEAYEHLHPNNNIEAAEYGRKLSHEKTMDYINYLIQADTRANIQDIQAILAYVVDAQSDNCTWAMDTLRLWEDPGMVNVNPETGTPVLNNDQYTDAFLRHAGVQIQKAKVQGLDIEPIMQQVSDAIATRPQLEIPIVRHYLKEHYNKQDVALELAQRAKAVEIEMDEYLQDKIAPQIKEYEIQSKELKNIVAQHLDINVPLDSQDIRETQQAKHKLHIIKENFASAITSMWNSMQKDGINIKLLEAKLDDARHDNIPWAQTLSQALQERTEPSRNRKEHNQNDHQLAL